jgi:hypothetical protein
MELGRHDAALQAVDQFIAKVPNSAEAWFGRSNVLFSVARHARHCRPLSGRLP